VYWRFISSSINVHSLFSLFISYCFLFSPSVSLCFLTETSTPTYLTELEHI
jgi:hypothetical protein